MKGRERGGILLLVLWLTTALSFVSLALAFRVRTEISATRYRVDAEQARFLARGAFQQALYLMNHPGLTNAEGNRLYEPGKPLDFSSSTGTAHVFFASDAGKLNVNTIQPELLEKLLTIAGVDAQEAQEIAEAIGDWRSPAKSSMSSAFDLYYAGLPLPYRATHRRLDRIEELLLVKGITKELFYGTIWRDENGNLVRRGGLNRLLATTGNSGQVDVNSAPYEVLRTIEGMGEEQAAALVAGRSSKLYRNADDLPIQLEPSILNHLSFGQVTPVFTITAAGRALNSVTQSLVTATVERDETDGTLRLVSWNEQGIDSDAFENAFLNASGRSQRATEPTAEKE